MSTLGVLICVCTQTQRMETKTIGLDDEAYKRLKAQKREGENFSDTVKRIAEEISADWHRSFGRYADEGERFEQAMIDSRERAGVGLAKRQEWGNEILRDDDETDDGE